MTTQEQVYFASRTRAEGTETRQAVAVVQCSVITSRAPAIVAVVVWVVTSILLLIW